jgi:hypothetical protein
MRKIELEIDRLVGYTLGGPEGNQVRKVGSTKLGCKRMSTDSPEELGRAAEPVHAA